MWFSGVNIGGGGGDDSRLSKITLAWMIAQCTKDNQLSFDIEEYLFDGPPLPLDETAGIPWATSLGKTLTWNLARSVEAFGRGEYITNETIYMSISL